MNNEKTNVNSLQILNRISSREYNLIYRYDCRDFKSEKNGLSFFFRYKEKLIKAIITQENDNIKIAFFSNQLDCKSLIMKSNLEKLPTNFESLVKQTDFF